MKIAVPLFKKRVSPHFGSSSRILLLEANGTTIYQETIWDLGGEGPVEIARRLVALGVEELICGGIQSHHKDWLISKGIKVVDNQRGVAKEIVHQLLKDCGERTPANKGIAYRGGGSDNPERGAPK